MVPTRAVAPVFYVATRPGGLDDHFLLRVAQREDQQYLVAIGDFKGLPQSLAIHGADNAPPKTLFRRTQEDALSSYSMIAAKRLSDLSVTENDDIS